MVHVDRLRGLRVADVPPRIGQPDDPACWSWPPLVLERGGFLIPPLTLPRAEQSEILRRWHAGRCGICAGERVIARDHDYRTGKVRGELCSGCNAAEGSSRAPETVYARWRACASAQILGLDIAHRRSGSATPVRPQPDKHVWPSYLPPGAPPFAPTEPIRLVQP